MLTLSAVVSVLFRLYTYTLFARILLSWIRVDPYGNNPIIRFIYDMTEPVMRPFRQLIPPVGGLDLSPILLFIVLNWLANNIVRILMRMGL